MMENGFLDGLPHDVLEVILFKLPDKPLVKCRSVSKWLNDFISSPRFIDSHLKQSKNSGNSKPYIFIITVSESLQLYHSMIRLRDDSFHALASFEIGPNFPLTLCYCDGMFLVKGKEERLLHLHNPWRRKLTTFSYPYKLKGVYGLCRDSATHEFNIVIGNGSCYAVYSSKSKSWRRRRTTNFPHSGDVGSTAGLSVAGAVYWDWVRKVENRDIQCIVCFDSRDEEFKILERPRVLKDTDRIHLVSCNDGLCVWFNNVAKSEVQVWSWNGNSWAKLLMISKVPMQYGSIKPLCFLEKKIVMHLETDRYVIYSLSEDMFEEFVVHLNLSFLQFFHYIPSLVFFDMLRTQPPRRSCKRRR